MRTSQVPETNCVLYFLLKFTENNLEYCYCIHYEKKAINMVEGNVIPSRMGELFIHE